MMTFTEVLHGISEDMTDFMEKSPEEAMCNVIKKSITDAAHTGRLVHGITESVSALQRDPKDVVICILPLDTSNCDVNTNIQLLLIESVCVEYDILVLKLDISQLDSGLAFTGSKAGLLVEKSVNSRSGSLDNAATKQPVKAELVQACPDLAMDLFCCVIQHGEEGPSFTDRKLLSTFQDLSEEEDNASFYGSYYNLNKRIHNPTGAASPLRHSRSSTSTSSDSSESVVSLESPDELRPE